MNKHKLLVILFLSTFSVMMNAQAGAHIFAGGVMVSSSDKNLTIPKSGALGYEVGLDARLNSDNMYFLVGGKYGVLGKKEFSYIKGRIGLGFDIFHFSHNIYLRTKIQGSLNFVNDYDSNIAVNPGYEKVNDGFAGVNTGLGLTLGALMFDIDYEYGIFNVAFKQADSKINFLGLNVGYRF